MAIDLSKFRPMLAAETDTFDWSKLKYPVYVSPKLDGIRCICHPTLGPVSRSLKPIPNKYIRTFLADHSLRWLDGEIVVGMANAPNVFNMSQSGVMTQSGEPDFMYKVFDNFEAGDMCGFGIRHEDAKAVVDRAYAVHPNNEVYVRVEILRHVLVGNYEQLLKMEEQYLTQGYEGLMIRSPMGKYKFGRSTQVQQGLLKMKRFMDAEARIVGYELLLRNENDPVIDALGLQKRGYSKDGKVADPTMAGKLNVIGTSGQWIDVAFDIGSGLDDDTRYDIVANFDTKYKGRIVTYKYQPHGSKDAPRTPIWKGLRGDE